MIGARGALRPRLWRSLGAMAIASAIGCAAGSEAASGKRGASEPMQKGFEIALLPGGVRGARLVPESLDIDRSFGVEPGGGLRGIAAGVRIVTYASGAVLSAPDRLLQSPTTIVMVPERMGGGVLFAIGETVWRAERWLARAQPIFRAPANVRSIWIGLDRVVLRLNASTSQRPDSSSLLAIDPTTGAPLDLGALPPSPAIAGYAALDGFRAVALADLRGVLATTDAGATWRTVPVPIEARDLAVSSAANHDALVLSGFGGATGHDPVNFEVTPEGEFTRIGASGSAGSETKSAALKGDEARSGEKASFRVQSDANGAKIFGQRALSLAITDGIPLEDGSALIAGNGAMGRVRLADGALIDVARDAFPLRAARCHGVVLDTRGKGEAGFVCGEARGRSEVYRYSSAKRELETLMAFDGPRAVLVAGNGTVAVRGRCASSAATPSLVPSASSPNGELTVCVRDRAGRTSERVLTGVSDTARIVALDDGNVVAITPPHGDLNASGGFLVTSNSATGPGSTRIPIVLSDGGESSAESANARRVISQGMWLDGFEERTPGVYSGWVEHAGTMLGVEIRSDGRAKHGAFIRDVGNAFVSGRFGLSWTGAQRGFETVDGGITWRAVEFPEKLERSASGTGAVTPFASNSRGCSAIGCSLSGWLRIGWGDAAPTLPVTPQSLPVAKLSTVPTVDLMCDVVARDQRGPVTAPTLSFPRAPTVRVNGIIPFVNGSWRSNASEWTPFVGVAPPPKHADDAETQYDVQELVDHQRNLGSIARAYLWGSKGLEWDTTSRWLLRWTSPFSGTSDVFSSPAGTPPRAVIEASRFAAGGSGRPLSSVDLAPSDDPKRALLIATRGGSGLGVDSILLELVDGRAPVEIRRADGEAFGRVDAATRVEGRWFLATDAGSNEPTGTVLWQVDGGVARELARVPRVDSTRTGGVVRLAHRAGMIGIVVDGQPAFAASGATDSRGPRRWVLGVDATSGRTTELETLGGAGGEYTLCRDAPGDASSGGWTMDVPLPGQPLRASVAGLGTSRPPMTLRSGYARAHFAREQACIERVAASYDGNLDDFPAPRRASADKTIPLALVTGTGRQELRCRAP